MTATTSEEVQDVCMNRDKEEEEEDDQAVWIQQSWCVKKYRSLQEIMASTEKKEEDYSELGCEECRSIENGEEMLICDKCERGYHMTCDRPIVVRIPTGMWYCSTCSPRLPLSSSLTQTCINQFFGLHVGAEEPMDKLPLEARKRRRHSSTLVHYKRRRRMLLYVPAEDASQRLQQMVSLASALMALNMKFSPELTYAPDMAPRSANKAKFQIGGIQILSKEDQETLNHIQAMGKRGLYPPLMLVYDSREGYGVVADGFIKDMTLLAEYVGDVDYMEKRENDDCDSLMTLVTAKNKAKSLVICPDKRANIARFINGVNNHVPGAKKKQNTKCVRYDVNGECRVLLVATRDIAKGDRLYYDYNEHEYGYPTHNFV